MLGIDTGKVSADEKALFAALKRFKSLRGHPAMRELLHAIAGVGAASEVPPEKRAAVIDAACRAKAPPSSLDAVGKKVWDARNKKPE